MNRRSFLGLSAGAALSPAQIYNRAYSAGLKPDPLLTVSEWADKQRVLSAIESPEPGPWRTSRTPYLRQIMDCLSPSSPVREVVIEKGTQLGLTVGAAGNFIGYTIDQAPGVMLIVMPTVDTAKRWSRQKLELMLSTTPCLKGKVFEGERDKRNTMLAKEYHGGMLLITGANSAVGLRSTSAPFMVFDEVDAYPSDVDKEGRPMALAKKRAQNYPRRKILEISTPVELASSVINADRKAGDRRSYFVPCPYCGHFQAFRFNRLEYWPKEKPEQAAYRCCKCERKIEERWKTQMLEMGDWVPTCPAAVRRGRTPEELDQIELALLDAGLSPEEFRTCSVPPSEENATYHLSSLYSPLGWLSWVAIAQQWVEAQKDQRLLKVFVNCVLGEPWVERGEAPATEAIYGKREFYEIGTVPRGGLFLTLTADVQADRIEYEVKAHGRNRETWSVDASVLQGDTSLRSVWDALDELIRKDWPHADGVKMPIWVAAIDTGYRPQMGYDFCARFPQPAYGPAGAALAAVRTVVPIKGGHAWDKAIEGFSSVEGARKRDGLRIITVGSSYCKQEVYNAIRLPMPIRAPNGLPDEPLVYPSGYWHYPAYEFFWFQGLTSESRIVREGGRSEWVKDGSVRNEPLDLGAYHVALAELCGAARFAETDWVELERRIKPQAKAEPPKPATEPQQGSRDWLGGRGDNWF